MRSRTNFARRIHPDRITTHDNQLVLPGWCRYRYGFKIPRGERWRGTLERRIPPFSRSDTAIAMSKYLYAILPIWTSGYQYSSMTSFSSGHTMAEAIRFVIAGTS